MLERDREVKNAGRVTIEGRAYRELVIVVTMGGRWTIKEKKKKEKRTEREGGREEEEEEEEEEGPLEKRFGGPRGSLYIPSRIFRHGREGGTETIWWWLGVWTGELNWFGDLPPSGPIYKSAVASSL